MDAFQVKADQISGPSWLDQDCFEIAGKIPAGATRDQIPALLRALLAERLKLVTHNADRARPVYALVVDKDGPKMKEADASSDAQGGGKVIFHAAGGTRGFKGVMAMETLARFLSMRGYGPVEDFTGLKGKYEVDLSWAPDPAFEPMGEFARAAEAEHPADLPSAPTADLCTAIRSLGLRLERRKEPLHIVVIDHIERFPTEN